MEPTPHTDLPEVSPADSGAQAWSRPANGLALFATSFGWRVAVAVLTALLLAGAIFQRSFSLFKLVSLLGPAASLSAAIGMAVGMHGFAQQPEGSPGKRLAMFAFVELSIACLLDGYALIKVFTIYQADASSLSAAAIREAGETAQTVSLWAMGLGFCALFVFLGSMIAVARQIRRPDLFVKVWSVGAMLLLSAAAVLGFRWHLKGPGANISFESAAMIGLGIALFVIATVVAYTDLARKLVLALQFNVDEEIALPTARIRSSR